MDKTLYTCIEEKTGKTSPALIKHLKAAGINDWSDLTRTGFYDFRDMVLKTVAPSSARTIFAVFRAFLNRFRDEVDICKDYAEILVAKNEKPVHTFLTSEEVKLFAAVPTHTRKEVMIKTQALIAAYTGLRVSDIEQVSVENVDNGFLTYQSIKTGTVATIPVSEKTLDLIRYAQEHKQDEPSLQARDRGLKRLCQKAGIDKQVKVYVGGKEKVGPKWQFISSHSFRRSFVTNLVSAGVSIADTARMAGHGSNITTTQRYICDYKISVPAQAMAYLGVE